MLCCPALLLRVSNTFKLTCLCVSCTIPHFQHNTPYSRLQGSKALATFKGGRTNGSGSGGGGGGRSKGDKGQALTQKAQGQGLPQGDKGQGQGQGQGLTQGDKGQAPLPQGDKPSAANPSPGPDVQSNPGPDTQSSPDPSATGRGIAYAWHETSYGSSSSLHHTFTTTMTGGRGGGATGGSSTTALATIDAKTAAAATACPGIVTHFHSRCYSFLPCYNSFSSLPFLLIFILLFYPSLFLSSLLSSLLLPVSVQRCLLIVSPSSLVETPKPRYAHTHPIKTP